MSDTQVNDESLLSSAIVPTASPPPEEPEEPEEPDEPGDEERRPVYHLADNLDTIGTAARLLGTRIAELQAEVDRQFATAEQLRLRLAEEMGANRSADLAECRAAVTAQQAQLAAQHAQLAAQEAELAAHEAELAALQATRLFRWSSGPRRLYRWLRRARHPRGPHRPLDRAATGR